MRYHYHPCWDADLSQYLSAALGAERFAAVHTALTKPPLTACLRVNTLNGSPEEVVNNIQQHLQAAEACSNSGSSPDDSGSNTRRARFTCSQLPQLPIAVQVHGTGPHNLPVTSPAGLPQVLVSRKTGEAVLRGAHVFVPGVLGASRGLQAGDLVLATCALEDASSSADGSRVTRGTTLPNVLLQQQSSGPTYPPQAATTARDDLGPAAAARVAGVPAPLLTDRPPAAAASAAGAATVPPQTPPPAAAVAAPAAHCAAGGKAAPQQPPPPAAAAAAAAAAVNPESKGQQQRYEEDSAAPAEHEPQLVAVPAGLPLGIGRAQLGRIQLFRQQQGLAVELVQRVWDVPPMNGVLPGAVMLQNLPSVVAGVVLSPAPGSRVLDMCAAPGGKTTLMAQLMCNQGEIVAWDRSHAKVDEINALAAELGCTIIQAHKMDATKGLRMANSHTAAAAAADAAMSEADATTSSAAATDGPIASCPVVAAAAAEQEGKLPQQQQQQVSGKAQQRLERRLKAMAARGHTPAAAELRAAGLAPPKHPRYPPESFDHILLDAPCTALGVRPRLEMPHTLGLLLQTAAYQRQLMEVAVQLLRPGGTWVYSTCSINPGENESNVRYVLDAHSCLQLVPATPRVGSPGLQHPADQQQLLSTARSCPTLQQLATKAAASTMTTIASSSCDAEADRSATAAAERLVAGDWQLSEQEAGMVQRFSPDDPLDTIGFFIAKFNKKCSCRCPGRLKATP